LIYLRNSLEVSYCVSINKTCHGITCDLETQCVHSPRSQTYEVSCVNVSALLLISYIINLISRLFYVIGVFSFVKDSDDIFTAALIQSLSFLLSGGLALYYVVSKFKLRYEIYSPRVYIKYISSGYYVFISNVFISFYTYGTLIFLGLYANSYMVGLFSTAHKIAEAANKLIEHNEDQIPMVCNANPSRDEGVIEYVRGPMGELKDRLDEKGIGYDDSHKKADLIELLENA